MKLSISVILVFNVLFATATISGDHYTDLFDQANLAYKTGHYDSAKAIYAEIVNNGFESPELFYNFGNAYYKDGNVPGAILYYERALKLNPADKDIRYNLEVVNSLIPDKINTVEPLFLASWWQGLANKMTERSWTWLFLGLLSLTCALFTIFFTSRNILYRQLTFISGIVVALTSLITVTLGFESKSLASKESAIVFSPSVNVKSEPSLNSTVQFVIHEGLKVGLLAEDGEWVRINLADGNSGWIPAQSIERI